MTQGTGKKSTDKIYIKYGIKRSTDIVLSSIGLIIVATPMLIIAIVVKITSPGPILIRQERFGKDGKVFTMYKFRSMCDYAEQVLENIMDEDEAIRREYKANKKLKNDPRVTKVGKILRETSLDELPQFLNILLGHMSIVGPRPYLLGELDDVKSHKKYIFAFRPGLTGMWQVCGRNKLSFQDRLKLDKQYHKTSSSKTDVVILLKTVKVVLKKVGAK